MLDREVTRILFTKHYAILTFITIFGFGGGMTCEYCYPKN